MHEFGAWIGETTPGNGANPKGFFENADIRDKILKQTLRTLGVSAAGVSPLPDPEINTNFKYLVDGQKVSMRFRMRQIVQDQGYDGTDRWMFKGAKLSLMWRMFNNEFPNADWIIVRRQREGFVKSCMKTHFMKQYSTDPAFWNNMADEYDLRLDQLKNTAKNVHEVHTDDILSGDTASLKSTVMKIDGLSFSIAKVRKFVDPKHWHHS